MESASTMEPALTPPQPLIFFNVDPVRDADRAHFQRNFRGRPHKIATYTQLANAAITILVFISFAVSNAPRRCFADMSLNLLAPVTFGLAGGLMLVALNKSTYCTVITAMVANIVATVVSLPLLMIVGGCLSVTMSQGHAQYPNRGEPVSTSTLVLLTMLLFVMVSETVASFIASVLCCRATCCRRFKASETVVYDPNNVMGGLQVNPGSVIPLKAVDQTAKIDTGDADPQMQDLEDTQRYRRL